MESIKKIKVALAEDHEITRAGFIEFMKPYENIEVVIQANSGEELIDLLQSTPVDVVVLDIRMKGVSGIETAIRIRENDKLIKIIMLTEHEQPSLVFKSIKANANGYLTKSKTKADEIYVAIQTVMSGTFYCNEFIHQILSKNVIYKNQINPFETDPYVEFNEIEKQILKHLCAGKTSFEIGVLINKSKSLVDNYRLAMCKKTKTHNATELIIYCLKNELLD